MNAFICGVLEKHARESKKEKKKEETPWYKNPWVLGGLGLGGAGLAYGGKQLWDYLNETGKKIKPEYTGSSTSVPEVVETTPTPTKEVPDVGTNITESIPQKKYTGAPLWPGLYHKMPNQMQSQISKMYDVENMLKRKMQDEFYKDKDHSNLLKAMDKGNLFGLSSEDLLYQKGNIERYLLGDEKWNWDQFTKHLGTKKYNEIQDILSSPEINIPESEWRK